MSMTIVLYTVMGIGAGFCLAGAAGAAILSRTSQHRESHNGTGKSNDLAQDEVPETLEHHTSETESQSVASFEATEEKYEAALKDHFQAAMRESQAAIDTCGMVLPTIKAVQLPVRVRTSHLREAAQEMFVVRYAVGDYETVRKDEELSVMEVDELSDELAELVAAQDERD